MSLLLIGEDVGAWQSFEIVDGYDSSWKLAVSLRSRYIRSILQYGDEDNPILGPIVGVRGKDGSLSVDIEGYAGSYSQELLTAYPVQRKDTESLQLPPYINQDLKNDGIAHWEDAVPPDLCEQLLQAILRLNQEDATDEGSEQPQFSLCRSNHGQDSKIRTDEVAFLDMKTSLIDQASCREGNEHLMQKVQYGFDLLVHLASQVDVASDEVLGPDISTLLRPQLGMVSAYRRKSFYQWHLDNERCDGNWRNFRVLTMILYLNKDWKPTDGGQLEYMCVTNTTTKPAKTAFVEPKMGTVVVFDARTIRHRVKSSHRDRYALTQWFVSPDLLKCSNHPIGPMLLPSTAQKRKLPSSVMGDIPTKQTLKVNTSDENKSSFNNTKGTFEANKKEEDGFSFGFFGLSS